MLASNMKHWWTNAAILEVQPIYMEEESCGIEHLLNTDDIYFRLEHITVLAAELEEAVAQPQTGSGKV